MVTAHRVERLSERDCDWACRAGVVPHARTESKQRPATAVYVAKADDGLPLPLASAHRSGETELVIAAGKPWGGRRPSAHH